MELNKNLAKLLFEEFEDSIKGTDIYNHEGSMWLIFTEERKWVVEFTNQKTLWYNYKHFNDILMLFGMEVSDGAKYIKKWYEDKFIFNAVKQNASTLLYVDDVIDNGVKEADKLYSNYRLCVENTIQNGVKDTNCKFEFTSQGINDAIKIGFKDTDPKTYQPNDRIEDVVENGVNVISWAHPTANFTNQVEGIIQNGVKETKTMAVDRIPLIKKVFQNGVKEVEYYDGDAEVLVNDAIENGIKEVMVGNGQVFLVSEVIKKGVKRTSSRGPFSDGTVEDAVKYGVKIVDYHILESMEQKDHSVTTLDFTEKIKDTIENGVKEISSVDCEYLRATENVIKNGVKYMMSGSEFKNKQVEDIIKYSEKL